jgi:hypothetical protein
VYKGQQMTKDQQSTIDGSGKGGRGYSCEGKAAPAVNGAFRCCVDHGSGRKVGADGRASVDIRQQWQRQTGNNQLKAMVASSGIDSHGGGGKQWWSTAIGSKTPKAKAIVIMPPTHLLSSKAGSGRWAAAAAARE